MFCQLAWTPSFLHAHKFAVYVRMMQQGQDVSKLTRYKEDMVALIFERCNLSHTRKTT